MTWLAVITAAIKILSAVVGYLHDKQLIAAGTAEAVAAHLQGALDDIDKANAVRDAVRRSFDPDAQLREPDPNRRD